MLNTLYMSGRIYGTTLADGSYGKLEITINKMVEVQKICQSVLNSYAYSGGGFPLQAIS